MMPALDLNTRISVPISQSGKNSVELLHWTDKKGVRYSLHAKQSASDIRTGKASIYLKAGSDAMTRIGWLGDNSKVSHVIEYAKELVRIPGAAQTNPVPPLRSSKGITPEMVGSLARKSRAAPPAKKAKRNPSPRSDMQRASELYRKFTGHDPGPIARVTVPDLPKSVAVIGALDFVGYTTVRNGKKESYKHTFRAKDKPLLCATPDGKQLLLVGGAYDFTDRGIIDASDVKNRR